MISYPSSLLAVGGARTGIAPVNLLDVCGVNGDLYYWSDRAIKAYNVITAAPSGAIVDSALRIYVPTEAATVLVEWEDQIGGGDQSFDNGEISIAFDGMGGATMTFLGKGSALFGADYGVANNFLVGDYQLNVAGPVAIPALPAAGQELVVQMRAQAGGGRIWVTGPASANSDDYQHARLTWTAGRNGVHVWTQPDPSLTTYQPWILSVPQLTFHRSSVTDVGNFILQNLSGDSVSRDFEKIMRKSALEGAFFVYRSYQADAQAAWIEVHGTLTVDDVGVDTVTLKGAPAINPAQDDTPDKEYSETCQWRWGSPQCGATGATECQYSYQTCQVLERILVVLNNYEKNFGETAANVPTQIVNRRRRF